VSSARDFKLDEGRAAIDAIAVARAIRNAAGSFLGEVVAIPVRRQMTKARTGEAARKIAGCAQTIESRLRE
jgi:DNA-binding IclR family transcriptional regulator